MNWLKELEQDLKNTKTRPVQSRTPVQSKKKAPKPLPAPVPEPKIIYKKVPDNNKWALPLFFLFLLLIVALFCVVKYKEEQTVQTQPAIPPVVVNPEPVQPTPPTLVEDPRIGNLTKFADKIWDRVKINTDRITLAGTLLNNNFSVDSKNLPRTKYVYLNDDWTIDKMPDQLSLDDNDREFLNKHMRRHGGHEYPESIEVIIEEQQDENKLDAIRNK